MSCSYFPNLILSVQDTQKAKARVADKTRQMSGSWLTEPLVQWTLFFLSSVNPWLTEPFKPLQTFRVMGETSSAALVKA